MYLICLHHGFEAAPLSKADILKCARFARPHLHFCVLHLANTVSPVTLGNCLPSDWVSAPLLKFKGENDDPRDHLIGPQALMSPFMTLVTP